MNALKAPPKSGLVLYPEPWSAINDGVMGGVSVSAIAAVGKTLRFHGELSLENNGGFASVRRSFDGGLEDMLGIRLRINGDGRSYQFRLRTDHQMNGVSWRHVFDTDGSWQTVDLLFEEFEPVFRGRGVPGAGPLHKSKIHQLGFLLADGKPGPFQLDIAAIEFIDR